MKKPDALHVQVAFKIGAKPGTTISKKVLNELLQRVVDNKPLPRYVEIRGIFWRNPNRRAPLDRWRYHEGADLTIAPRYRESSPRGDLQDAIATLFDSRLPIDYLSFS